MKPALFVLAVALAAPASQDKVTLKSQPVKGDKLTESEKMSMKIALTVTAGGQKIELGTEERHSKKKNFDILEVEGGKVTRARWEIEEDVDEKKEPGAEAFTRSENPLHGRKVSVQSKDGKLVYEGADGLDEKARKSLDLDDDFAKSFPKQPVAVGESWDVPGEVLKEMFNDDKLDGKMTVKLAEVKEHEGRRCAFLDTRLEMKGKIDEGIALTASLKGVVIVWIERGYTMRVKLEGKVAMSGKTPEAEMKGEGPMTVDVTTTVR